MGFDVGGGPVTRHELWKVWHECKARVAHAPSQIHEEFDEDWNDYAIGLLNADQREELALYMRGMAENYETYECLHGEPGGDA